jgi:hypothetical protein
LGDQNTNFFENFVNHRKRVNEIWELSNREGRKFIKFKDRVELGVYQFEEVFKELDKANIEEILKVASYFLRLVGEEYNERAYRAVTGEDPLYVLNVTNKPV